MTNPDVIVTTVFTEGDEYGTYDTTYGYKVCEAHNLAKVVDQKLFLGDYEIEGYNYAELKGLIPLWFVVRTSKRFVCGLDLIDDGLVWLGDNDARYDNFDDLLKDLRGLYGDDFKIYMEDEQTI